ncbi:DUF2059 domain-containing protein [uncultured Ruegeria sp.]|uniref:DUF2059 domain-containing protein n=1 Tax=uncultured Ruegeria sp. TaxID=259304 RepID=UPI002629A031|nr:DUF2059 domain-containing protein [uncultured Ruegeria sp.]
MRRVLLAIALVLWGLPLQANEKIDRLAQAMHLSQVMEILVQEGQGHREELDDTLLDNTGGAFFETQVKDIYDPLWMQTHLTDAFEAGLSDAQLDQAILFFESELGQTIVALENSARQAMSDQAIEDMAHEAYESAKRDTTRFELIDEYIQANDLIEKNVQGALSSDYNFFRGLDIDSQGDDQELLAELLLGKDSRTEETEAWLYSFLLMAYRPLDEAQMRENIAFSRTETGRALNEALFEGFDRMFNDISFQLGQAVAQTLRASDL